MDLKNVSSEKNENKQATRNPYLSGEEGRKEWNDRYMNMAKSTRNWQFAFAGMALITICLTLTVAKIASESRVEPFLVEMNQGMPIAIKPMQNMSINDQRLINFAVNQFIINTKTVLSDPKGEAALINKSYAYASDNTLDYLKTYFEQNNPLDAVGKYTVSVSVVNSLPLSGNTWQITWDETKRFINSDTPPTTTRWMADITYKFGEVNPDFKIDNPFGLYFTNISWSQSTQPSNERTN